MHAKLSTLGVLARNATEPGKEAEFSLQLTPRLELNIFRHHLYLTSVLPAPRTTPWDGPTIAEEYFLVVFDDSYYVV